MGTKTGRYFYVSPDSVCPPLPLMLSRYDVAVDDLNQDPPVLRHADSYNISCEN